MTVTRRAFLATATAVPLVAFVASRASAGEAAYYNNGGVAIDGSDAVAYFTQGRPVMGNAAHSLSWRGVTWHFATAENLALFEADPLAYAPQFGGYCAWAVSQGYVASTVPEAWSVVDGKLYLNYSRRIRRRWERDIPAHIAAGNANWPAVLDA